MSNDLPPTSNAPMSAAIFPGIEGLNTIPPIDAEVKAALHATRKLPTTTRVWRRFVICSAHYLPGHSHCGCVHGHNYIVEVCVTGWPNAQGMIIDFAKLKELFEPIKNRYDHKLLNDCEEFFSHPPTVENMAMEVAVRMQAALRDKPLARLAAVRIFETPDSWCEVEIQDASSNPA